ncbi:hypothetical protein CERSUDRAFT_112972 [Gelatoporia subvermispora B]|uniref:DNA polymerase delta subunit 4 n=1 Tax=Ceriporiopsis subvermispora (strain B) TaxID=914234 RepID=M2QQH6_CERS8|nr:hypothetical protein CERSUDRAFT_112972 [Gelatoporia subvermispora B]
MKQGTLGFAASKRSSSANNLPEKDSKLARASTSAAPSSASPEVADPIEIFDSDEDDDPIVDEAPVTPRTPAGRKADRGEPSPKRRKTEKSGARTRVFDLRDSIENVESDDEVEMKAKRKRGKGRRKANTEVEEEPVKTERLVVKVEKGTPESWRRHYGVVREKMGHLQPIHAKGETMIHHILRVFDLSYEYGPCIGVTRMQRWERAEVLGLKPPPEVKEILESKGPEFSESVFYGEV